MYKIKCKIAYSKMIRTIWIDYDAYNEIKIMWCKIIDAYKEMYRTQWIGQDPYNLMHRNRRHELWCQDQMPWMKECRLNGHDFVFDELHEYNTIHKMPCIDCSARYAMNIMQYI